MKNKPEIDIASICFQTLKRLQNINYESTGCENNKSDEQLIFPLKKQKKGIVDRVSEQELRLLFIEEFKIIYKDYFYSIETPTQEKYNLKSPKSEKKQSALLDMCIYKKQKNKYNRVLNIEFKHKNTTSENIAKDILKLTTEHQNGVFIHLLNNTNAGTFCNTRNTGILNKFYNAFNKHKVNWKNNKHILIVIMSLKQKSMVYKLFKKNDLNRLENIFLINEDYINIDTMNKKGWKLVKS